MRVLALILMAALLAGCVSASVSPSSSSSSRVTRTSGPETVFEEEVPLGPEPRASSTVTLTVPTNASFLTIRLSADNSANLRGGAEGCEPSGSGNLQVSVGGRTTTQIRCASPTPGELVLTITRDAGVGPVLVEATAQVERVTRS